MDEPTRGTDADHSRGNWPSRAARGLSATGRGMTARLGRLDLDLGYLAAGGLAIAAVLGPLLMIVSDFTTLFEVKAVTAVLKDVPGGVVSGGRNHSYAMLIIGLVAAPMAYGAIRGGSRAAMVALAALGAVGALIALAVDLPDATGTNTLAKTFAEAKGMPSIGFYLETLGAALTLIAGGGALMITGGQSGEEAGPRLRSSLRKLGRRSSPESPPAAPDGTARDERQRTEAAEARAAARAHRPGAGPLASGDPLRDAPRSSPAE